MPVDTARGAGRMLAECVELFIDVMQFFRLEIALNSV